MAPDTLMLTAMVAQPGVAVAGTQWGWEDWPVVNFYNNFGQPLVPWSRNVTA